MLTHLLVKNKTGKKQWDKDKNQMSDLKKTKQQTNT